MAISYLRQCDPISGCGHQYPGDLAACPKCGTPEMFSDPAIFDPRYYTYDIETYPNTFTCCFTHLATDTRWRFEISDRVNQIDQFIAFVYQLRDCGAMMVGYNNFGFDYPVVHYIMLNPWVSHVEIYNKAMQIIRGNDKFGHIIWPRDQIVKQVDLFKIWHFDNKAKSTRLKALEIAMRMKNVEDLPFPVGTILDDAQKDVLLEYNEHDVIATSFFLARSLGAIKLRQELSEKFGKDFTNDSDVKMGEKILITEMEKAGITVFDRIGGQRVKRQTFRSHIALKDVIFPYVQFEHPEFQRIKTFLESKVISETKGVFKGLTATVDGLEYKFGTGGIHASVDCEVFQTNDTHQIVDVDVR